ncbi:aspartate aminotransferase family protein [Anaerovorax odorimutans]|uniref:Aspartate aminotransferase family protein n=1 Tax=Anaerovorax odorimutans TaxID=109327 RepID=A0ABT1RRP6_9FIRM|nr:aspartate aminotransferase family protein [Anaerovorax odorimutans]MCQ4637862.1 aspartate aminotransferase family protein [Anaerovorax odorimutans]
MRKNTEMFHEASKRMTGGGSAGGRIHKALGAPFYIDHADGSHVFHVDGGDFIDYHCGAGALLFGWNHPGIREAVMKCMDKGFYMNFDSQYTLEFAELFTKLVPTVEKIRLTNSGTEATLAAIRAARAYTKKNLIIKMDGHFHGMHEMIWFNGGCGTNLDEFGETRTVTPAAAGFPQDSEKNVRLIEFNNINAVRHVFEKYRGDIAAIILEPVNYDCGCVPSTAEYMKQVRELCTKEGILLIFDEVISGLRFRPGSAQGFYGVKPDLSTFAKAIANGFSLALVGGKAEIMDMFNPAGPVVCSGTSSGNLMSVMAGIACIKMALEPGFYDKIEEIEKNLCGEIDHLFRKHGIPGHIRSQGAQFAFYFGYDDPRLDYTLSETVKYYSPKQYRNFTRACLAENLYMFDGGGKPFPQHNGFTTAHTEDDIALTITKIDKIFSRLAQR